MRRIFGLAALAIALSPIPGLAADVKAGEATYAKTCKLCHGADGKGVAAIFKALQVAVVPDIATKTDAEIKTAVTTGKNKMTPVTTVTPKDIPDVIAYVRTLSKSAQK